MKLDPCNIHVTSSLHSMQLPSYYALSAFSWSRNNANDTKKHERGIIEAQLGNPLTSTEIRRLRLQARNCIRGACRRITIIPRYGGSQGREPCVDLRRLIRELAEASGGCNTGIAQFHYRSTPPNIVAHEGATFNIISAVVMVMAPWVEAPELNVK